MPKEKTITILVTDFCFDTKAIFEGNGKITVDETGRTEAIRKWNRRYE